MAHKIKKTRPAKQVLFAILIAFAVVSFWRGVWGLMDEFLFPNNHNLSLITSVVVGLIILVFTRHAIKELM